MKCLADNVYHEARVEPVKGQMLVARVTLNRAKKYHSGDICKAVYQKGQFSWTNGFTMNKPPKIFETETYANAARAAYAALWYHQPVYYFHATYVKPEWAYKKKVVAKVGKHIFYA